MQMVSGNTFSSIPSTLGGLPPQGQKQSTNPNPKPNPNPASRKKRNLPGTPDPDAEVVALSPKTLMATNRFICEICNKGFQRDQNLQLHRRGHNLPWKLKQRTNKEVKKKVYICPEKTCVHHDPSRALGDLTGIKKHYSRKHGEKKWKCDKCSKKYAVQSDWKAHSKTCGTREYKCDCGTLFSRKDSFVTHRAFCDALAQESARLTSVAATNLNFRNDTMDMSSHGFSNQGLQEVAGVSQFGSGFRSDHLSAPEMVQMGSSGNIFGSSSMSNFGEKEESSSLYSDSQNKQSKPVAAMSATALLQKAAQMGSTRSSPSSLFGNSFNVIASSSLKTTNFNSLYQNRNELQQVFQNVNQTMSDGIMGSSSTSTSNLKLHQGSNPMENSLTRDFLGMCNDQSGRPFFSQELAKFATMGSPMGLSQFPGNH
ncbi:zinc finger protein JACKDAW-like isoform X2 [Mangifera indica]|uniref:zinc finger protein JACKDAW-like isoform X2 n=1 Tax=Mangifera indica TaxID=29780 RepID=UPI001CFBA04B|nr:zinc finger protein JACKDAW-like isoform X2 [Mangifera indica]